MKIYYTNEEFMVTDLMQRGVPPEQAEGRTVRFIDCVENGEFSEILDLGGFYLTVEEYADSVQERSGVIFRSATIGPGL